MQLTVSNQQPHPADPPHNTVPLIAASLINKSSPIDCHLSMANKLLPPDTTITSENSTIIRRISSNEGVVHSLATIKRLIRHPMSRNDLVPLSYLSSRSKKGVPMYTTFGLSFFVMATILVKKWGSWMALPLPVVMILGYVTLPDVGHCSGRPGAATRKLLPTCGLSVSLMTKSEGSSKYIVAFGRRHTYRGEARNNPKSKTVSRNHNIKPCYEDPPTAVAKLTWPLAALLNEQYYTH